MIRINLILICFLTTLIIWSCNSDNSQTDNLSDKEISISEREEVPFSSPEQLVAYVNSADNGYYKEKEIDEIKFSALLKPIEYIKANEQLKSSSTKIAENDDLQYFDLRITVKDFNMEFLKYNLSTSGEYSERVNYCAYDMQKDIFLIDGKDTLSCIFYHFERAYNVVPFGHFLLAFKPTNKNVISPKTLVYYDRLFNKGLIKIHFTPSDLKKTPKLITT